MRSRAPRLTIIALASVVMLDGCLSKAINKRDAGELVRASAAFTRPKFAHIPRFITFRGYSYSGNGVLPIADLAQLEPTLAILKLQRLISVNESVYGSGSETVHQLVVAPIGIDSTTLTADEDPRAVPFDPQDQFATEEIRGNYSRAGYFDSFKKEIGWRIPIGTRQFLEVQQIHNWRDANENIPVNELAVDFTWRWVPNDFGRRVRHAERCIPIVPGAGAEVSREPGHPHEHRSNDAQPGIPSS